jgi:hypothetical protein
VSTRSSSNPKYCQVRLDRLLLTSWAPAGWAPPKFANLRIVRDHLLHTSMYRRIREYADPKTGCRIFWQYQRRRPWVAKWRINIVSGKDGLCYEDLTTVLYRCRYHQIVEVEVAFDFARKVDHQFVKRYAMFGKSQPHITPYEEMLYYGSRKGRKFIRCYQKDEVNAFRIELQLNSRMLRAELTSRRDQLGCHADVSTTLQQLPGCYPDRAS